MFGATFAFGVLLLAGAALVVSLSAGISEEQRASQALYAAFGGYRTDCTDLAMIDPTKRVFWCGSLFHNAGQPEGIKQGAPIGSCVPEVMDVTH